MLIINTNTTYVFVVVRLLFPEYNFEFCLRVMNLPVMMRYTLVNYYFNLCHVGYDRMDMYYKYEYV